MVTFLKEVFLPFFAGTYRCYDLGRYTMDQFSFYQVFSLKNEGVTAVFPKITFMTSRDRKCVGEARKWRHAVRILLTIILVFT